MVEEKMAERVLHPISVHKHIPSAEFHRGIHICSPSVRRLLDFGVIGAPSESTAAFV